jgi:hypothetical protein
MKLRPAALIVALVALIAGAAWLDGSRGEPAARRRLALRAVELEAWLRQELLAPIERGALAEAGAASGTVDAADAWRAVIGALEASAVVGDSPPLPSAEGEGATGRALRAALGARRFTPFPTIEALFSSEWLRGARLLATRIERAPAADPSGPIEPWLDAALVLAADLRSTGLLAPALGAAELEEAVERRLAGAGAAARARARVDPDGRARVIVTLRSIVAHADAAAARLPSPDLVAERESRLAQACVCAHARVKPFDGALADEADAAWPVVEAAQAVERLEGYDARLRELLVPPAGPARARFEAWSATLARELPRAAALVADPDVLPPLRDAALRLARIRDAAARRLD